MRFLALRALLQASLVLLATLDGVGANNHAAADDASPTCSATLRRCDSLWLVSTRAFACGDPRLHAHELTYQVRTEQGEWKASDLASFLAADDPRVTTVIWIHGNRYEPADARNHGLWTYRVLSQCINCDIPMRFVIFSWPSEQQQGVLDDVRVKAIRSNPNGYYLAWLLDQISGNVQVSLIGYSYGARIATGALHLLGGGTLCGWMLDERLHPDRRPMHVVLVAAAMDNHWLIPGHRHGNTLSQVEHMTVIYNSCDRVLKRYRYVYCHGSDAEALGYTGVAGRGRLGADGEKIQQFDACCYAGKEHGWENYVTSGLLVARMRRELFAARSVVVTSEP